MGQTAGFVAGSWIVRQSPRFFQKKAPKRTNSHFRYTVSKERLKEVKSYSRYARNKNSFISFTRKSYKLAMEEVLGAIDVLRPVGEFMVWRSEIAPVTQP